MPQSPRPKPQIYTFRVRILGGYYAPPDSTAIWRDIEIPANQTLADLGHAIPLAFDFGDAHLWAFFLNGKAWDSASEYSLRMDPGPPDESAASDAAGTLIRDVPFPGKTGKAEFLFLFDFGDEWHFGVKLRNVRENTETRERFPRIVAEHGAAPPQYPSEEDWDDDDDDEEVAGENKV